jgi:hypothetical protein
MRKRSLTVAIGALAAAASMTLHAQAPQTAPTPQPPDHPRHTITQTPTRAMPANPVMTITGCLTERKEARSAPLGAAGRAGMIDDYILTNVKMSPSSTVSGIGVATKFDVRGIVEADLKKHVNQQVELIGQIVRPETETPADDTPDFLATTLKVVSATCVAEG